jgi:hypothetical protein
MRNPAVFPIELSSSVVMRTDLVAARESDRRIKNQENKSMTANRGGGGIKCMGTTK